MVWENQSDGAMAIFWKITTNDKNAHNRLTLRKIMLGLINVFKLSNNKTDINLNKFSQEKRSERMNKQIFPH